MNRSMQLNKKILVILFIVSLIFLIHAQIPAPTSDTPYVELTWMSNTNWLIETADVRILLDGWITRIPRPARPDLRKLETLTLPPLVPDTANIRRVFKALKSKKKINYIISGHSHFDHSFDTAVWARLTGAQVMGPRSTCLQAIAQGIPESKCTTVHDGETFDLGSGLSVRVVRWHHSGDPSNPLLLLLQTPMELMNVPKPDPLAGGLCPGILDDFPMGLCLGFLFTLHRPENPITWFWSNSGNPHTFRESKNIDDAFMQKYGITLTNLEITPQDKSVEEYLTAAMTSEKLDSIDLWLGYNNSYHVEQVVPIMKLKAFIPQHWGGLWTPFFEGLKSPYSNARLDSVLNEKHIKLLVQSQYMDKFRLDNKGIIPISNDTLKEKLGFID